jgi:hypothetical protein
VDEAQVKAVMTELQRAVPYDDDSRFDHAAVARRLVERGVRVDGAS